MLSPALKTSSTFGDTSIAKSAHIVVNYSDSTIGTTASDKFARLLDQTFSSFIKESSSLAPELHSKKPLGSSSSNGLALTSSLLSIAAKRFGTFRDSSNAKSSDIVISSSDSKSGTTASDKLTRLLTQSLGRRKQSNTSTLFSKIIKI